MSTGAIRVLLVEDDERLARLTAKYLESHALHVTIAPDGEQGLALATSSSFDVVLLDLMLPAKDGVEVCRALEQTAAAALLEKAAARFRSAHAQHKLELDMAPALPSLVVDPTLLRRALDNLLDNAGKYSEPGSTVKLAARVDGAGGERLVIDVVDHGIGMDASDQAELFTPFFRAERSRTRKSGGVGLGLVLTKRIIEAHQGTIAVDSELGRGTTMTITLPIA